MSRGAGTQANNLQTLLTDSEDPEAVRELFKVFIQEVEVFELEDGATDQRVVIYYDLRAFKASGQDGSNTETIQIGKTVHRRSHK